MSSPAATHPPYAPPEVELLERQLRRCFRRLRRYADGPDSLHVKTAVLEAFTGVVDESEGPLAPVISAVEQAESALTIESASREDLASILLLPRLLPSQKFYRQRLGKVRDVATALVAREWKRQPVDEDEALSALLLLRNVIIDRVATNGKRMLIKVEQGFLNQLFESALLHEDWRRHRAELTGTILDLKRRRVDIDETHNFGDDGVCNLVSQTLEQVEFRGRQSADDFVYAMSIAILSFRKELGERGLELSDLVRCLNIGSDAENVQPTTKSILVDALRARAMAALLKEIIPATADGRLLSLATTSLVFARDSGRFRWDRDAGRFYVTIGEPSWIAWMRKRISRRGVVLWIATGLTAVLGVLSNILGVFPGAASYFRAAFEWFR